MNWLKKLANVLVIMSAAILSSCTSFGRPVELPLPHKPNWPELRASDYSCLPDALWEQLDMRSAIRDGYEESLRKVIESTHK